MGLFLFISSSFLWDFFCFSSWGSHHIAQAGLDLMTLLPQPPKIHMEL
jgi:hypothetical protein